MSFVVYLTNNIGPTSVGVNAFITIVLLTLITNCDGGAPLATQHTHFCFRAEMLRHPCILGGPQQRGQNQKSKPTLGVTMMLHATKRGFKDCPGFLNSTGRLGPKRGRKWYVTPAFLGVPNKGDKSEVKTYVRGRDDAPSISKCGSLVQPGAQVAALREVHPLSAPPKRPLEGHESKKMPGALTFPHCSG